MKICSKLNGGKQMCCTALILPSAFLLLKARLFAFQHCYEQEEVKL